MGILTFKMGNGVDIARWIIVGNKSRGRLCMWWRAEMYDVKKGERFHRCYRQIFFAFLFLRATVHIICFHRKISQLSGNFSSNKTNSTSSCLTIKLQLWLVPAWKKTLHLTQTRTSLVSQNGSERALSASAGIKRSDNIPTTFRFADISRFPSSSIFRFSQSFSNIGPVSSHIADLPTTGFRFESWDNFCLVLKGRIAWKTANFCGKCGVWVQGWGRQRPHVFSGERESDRENCGKPFRKQREEEEEEEEEGSAPPQSNRWNISRFPATALDTQKQTLEEEERVGDGALKGSGKFEDLHAGEFPF